MRTASGPLEVPRNWSRAPSTWQPSTEHAGVYRRVATEGVGINFWLRTTQSDFDELTRHPNQRRQRQGYSRFRLDQHDTSQQSTGSAAGIDHWPFPVLSLGSEDDEAAMAKQRQCQHGCAPQNSVINGEGGG